MTHTITRENKWGTTISRVKVLIERDSKDQALAVMIKELDPFSRIDLKQWNEMCAIRQYR